MTVLVAVLLLVPAADAKDKELSAEAKKEVKKLEGKWKLVKGMKDGKEENQPDGKDITAEFTGTKFRIADMDLFEISALDPTTAPKCIDFKALLDKGSVTKGTVFEGIYKLDGDTLVLALYEDGGSQRPDKFESPQGSKFMVITFERVKK